MDIVITDYAMPGMTGDELADAVQAGWPDLPILVISGYAELPPGFATRFPRLPKPFREVELAAALSDLLHQLATGDVVAFRPRA